MTPLATFPRRLAHRRLAGRRARERYSDLRAAWLRQNRRKFAIVALALVGIGVTLSAYDRVWFGRFGVVTGLAWGVVLTMWVCLRDSLPSFISHWQQGAWGEQFTADELAQLPASRWEPIHDLPDRKGNIDHVVLGPAGVFVVDSKKYSGIVHVDGDDLVVTNEFDGSPRYTDRGRLAASRAQASRFSAQLRAATGRFTWVEPVIVVWGLFPSRVHRGKGVTVVHGRELVSWLESQPSKGVNACYLAEHIRGGRHRRR